MAIRIPDNLMNRPLQPGGMSDGTEQVTRLFGNREEQAAGLPSAPSGWGGVGNPAAGVEGQAMQRAADTIQTAATDAMTYYDNLRTAEEDSRSKLMFLEIDKVDADVRARLDQDPEYAKKGTAEQQSIYETERDVAIDAVNQNYGFTQKKVKAAVDINLATFKAQASAQYLDKVVKPRVVFQSQVNDQKSDMLVIDKVTVEPTAENVGKAAANILDRYNSPQAYATYGAQGAMQLRIAAITKLQAAALTGWEESVGSSDLARLPGGAITTENMRDGAVGAIVGDQLGRLNTLLSQLPISEAERLTLANKGEKYVLGFAKQAIADHNKEVKDQERAVRERVQDSLDTWAVQTGLQAENGGLTRRAAFASYQKLVSDPDIAADPHLQRKAFAAYGAVMSKIHANEAEARRLASDAKTRQSIAQLRVENGIAVSGAALDGVWKKNGMLQSFFNAGNVVTQAHLQEIGKAGAVPTSVLGSIQADLRSQDPQVQRRGISNMLAIKNFSSNAQQGLYRELPPDFAGVIQRVEAGQSAPEALAFLTRPRQTPDVEHKLRTQADDKKNRETADAALKASGLDPAKMSAGLRDQFQTQWQDAFSRANGDGALATSLFRQDVSKNRRVGVSDFSGKVEMWPTTNFAPKATVLEIIRQDFPETKGKEVTPVYGGFRTVNGQQLPTYDLYVKGEDGLLKRVTDNTRQFYLTPEAVAKVGEAQREAAIEKGVSAGTAVKEAGRAIERETGKGVLGGIRDNERRRTERLGTN